MLPASAAPRPVNYGAEQRIPTELRASALPSGLDFAEHCGQITWLLHLIIFVGRSIAYTPRRSVEFGGFRGIRSAERGGIAVASTEGSCSGRFMDSGMVLSVGLGLDGAVN